MESWTDFRIHARHYHSRYQVHCFGIYSYYLQDRSRDLNKIFCIVILIFNCLDYTVGLSVRLFFKLFF